MKSYYLLVGLLFTLPVHSMSYLKSLAGYTKEYYKQQLFDVASGQLQTKELNSILDSGNVDINSKDAEGDTPLHIAAYKNNLEALSCFILYPPIDLNTKNNQGYTPFDYAVVQSNVEAVKLLLDAKADPDTQDVDGLTSLHKALLQCRSSRYLEIIKIVLQAGASTDIKDSKGTTPTDIAYDRINYWNYRPSQLKSPLNAHMLKEHCMINTKKWLVVNDNHTANPVELAIKRLLVNHRKRQALIKLLMRGSELSKTVVERIASYAVSD